MEKKTLQLERLVDDPEIRRAAAKTLKGFCLTYLPHHLPFDLSDAYQQAAIEEMERRAFAVEAMHPIKDKRARLRVAARYIKMGVVKFPRTGCEQPLTQLLGFGSEKHDDAVDALVYLILGLVGDGIEEQKVHGGFVHNNS